MKNIYVRGSDHIKAAKVLGEILLNNNKLHLLKSINRRISNLEKKICILRILPQKDREYFLKILFNETSAHIKNYEYDLNIETHLLNIFNGLVKKEINSISK